MPTIAESPPALSGEALSVDDLSGRWFVAATKSRAEKALAWDILAVGGVGYYLPMGERLHTDKHRSRYITEEPLFPGYVFCCGDDDAPQAVRDVGYRNGHLCTIVPIPAGAQFRLLSDLKNVEKAVAAQPRIESCPFAVEGAKVRIASGRLIGIEGTCIRRGAGSIIVIGVKGFVGSAMLEIDGELLEPAD